MLQVVLYTALGYLREFAAVAVFGFFVAGVLNAAVNKAAVVRHLGGNVIGTNALAAASGFVMPLCCCSGIPMALTLYRSGSHRGPACAFLIAVPWFNWYGLAALVIFLGWRAALVISLSAAVIGFLAGMVIDVMLSDARPAPRSESAVGTRSEGRCADRGCCDSGRDRADRPLLDFSRPTEKIISGARFALDLVRELGPWMLAGILLGVVLEAIVRKEIATGYLGKTSLVAVVLALVIAGAFYTDSLASLPWVRTLLDKGLGAGSGMILLVAGVGTNVSTLGPVARVMGSKTAVVYAASVVLLTGTLGYLLNRVL
jgi:uncharacterized membrane protein YraQ (UPF0718 family)